MKLIELTTVNFMPYKGKMTIAFPTDASKNIMLVYGDNMRGKTSLLNALRWAFYGKALGRHSRELPLHSLVNSEAALEGDWTMESCVIFEAGGHRYEYRRRAVKGKLVSKPSRPTDFEVERALKKDDMVMRGGSWDDGSWYACCASRDRCNPVFRNYGRGFRVSLCAAP